MVCWSGAEKIEDRLRHGPTVEAKQMRRASWLLSHAQRDARGSVGGGEEQNSSQEGSSLLVFAAGIMSREGAEIQNGHGRGYLLLSSHRQPSKQQRAGKGVR